MDPLSDLRFQVKLVRMAYPEFIAGLPDQAGQIQLFEGILLLLPVDPVQVQHILDHIAHPAALTLDQADRFSGLVIGQLVLFQGQLALGQDGRHRSAKLMGNIRGELLLRLEGPVQPLHHPVEGTGQLLDLIPLPRSDIDPLFQVSAGADVLRRVDQLADWPQGPLGDQVAADGRQDDQEGQEDQTDLKDAAHFLPVLVPVDRTSQPELAPALELHLLFINIENIRAGPDRVDLPLLHGDAAALFRDQVLSEKKGLPVTEESDAYPVRQIIEVVFEFQPSVLILLVLMALDPAGLLTGRIIADLVHIIFYGFPQVHLDQFSGPGLAGIVKDSIRQPQDHDQDQDEPYGDFCPDGKVLHLLSSPRITYPLPRTVWISFTSSPSSILRRR